MIPSSPPSLLLPFLLLIPATSCWAWTAGVTCGRKSYSWPMRTAPARPPRSTKLCPASSVAIPRGAAWRSSPSTGTRTTTTKPFLVAMARMKMLAAFMTILQVSVCIDGTPGRLAPALLSAILGPLCLLPSVYPYALGHHWRCTCLFAQEAELLEESFPYQWTIPPALNGAWRISGTWCVY